MTEAMNTPKQPDRNDPNVIRKNQFKLLGIFAIAVVPVIFAFTMYFGGMAIPSSKTNKGNLVLPPIPLSVLGYAADGDGVYVQTDNKWVLLLLGNGSCELACKDLLHTVRQVNISMGREMERVARAITLSASDAQQAEVLETYPNIQLWSSVIDQESFSQQAAERGAVVVNAEVDATESWQLWLVDPLGNMVLQYDASHTGYDMIADLKRLLKLSNIG